MASTVSRASCTLGNASGWILSNIIRGSLLASGPCVDEVVARTSVVGCVWLRFLACWLVMPYLAFAGAFSFERVIKGN